MTARSIVVKALGVIIGLVFVVFGFQERSSITRVKSMGHSAMLQPIGGYTIQKKRGSTTYMAEFSFRTDAGRQVKTKRSFPEEVLPDLQRNNPVKVFYDPSDPTHFVFEKESPSWALVGIGVAIAAIAAILG